MRGGLLATTDLERRFDALFAAHGPALARLAASYAREPGDRDDLLQEIAVAIWRALPGFRGECSERTFAFRIAHNRGISHLTRRRPPTADLDEDMAVPDARPDPEQALSADERSRRLFNAVQQLALGVVVAVAVTVVFGGGTFAWALIAERADVVVLAMGTWVFIAITWAVSFWLEGGRPWKPASTTTAAYLDFCIQRRRTSRQAIAAAAVLYVVFLAFMLVWKHNELSQDAPLDVWTYLTSPRVMVIAAVTAALAAVAVWRRRVLQREWQYLTDVRRQLGAGSDIDGPSADAPV